MAPAIRKYRLREAAMVLLWLLFVPVIAYVASTDVKMGLALSCGVLGLAMVVISFSYPLTGFYIAFTITMVIRLAERLYGEWLPVGPVLDTLIYTSLAGCMLRMYRSRTVQVDFLRDPLLLTQYILFAYLLLQAFNPNMYSLAGWGIYIKGYIRYMSILFLALLVFNNMAQIRNFIKYWLLLSALAALYGCTQDWFGLLPFELRFQVRMASEVQIILANNRMRVYSFMSDPAVLGLLMACSTIISLILVSAPRQVISARKKLALVAISLLQLLALGYTGTRTGYVMVPAGILMYALLNMDNRNTIIATALFAAIGIGLLFAPIYGNGTLNRVRSAFIGSKDASLNVRDVTRHGVQSYVHSHPIGSGLFTMAKEGEAFNPGHPMNPVQPDSGYLRAMVETGYIGLFLLCVLYGLAVQYAAANCFRAQDPRDKILLLCLAGVLFAIVVGTYAQMSGGLMESAFFFNALIGITVKIKYIYKQHSISQA